MGWVLFFQFCRWFDCVLWCLPFLMLPPGWFCVDVWKAWVFIECAGYACIFLGRTSAICRWESSLINFCFPSSCSCQSGCEMWQAHGQLCAVEICCVWNYFLFSTLPCELGGKMTGNDQEVWVPFVICLNRIYWFFPNHKTLFEGTCVWEESQMWGACIPVWAVLAKE